MHLQPYDRATGTELSPQQQQECQRCYTSIKAYIDAVERQTASALPWSRRALRCSTLELLASIGAVANDIEQRELEDARGYDNLGSLTEFQEVMDTPTHSSFFTMEPGSYKHAVNLLHELVGRFADAGDIPGRRFSQETSLDTRTSQGSYVPESPSNNSDASAGFSNFPRSRISYITNDSATTSSSKTSDDPDQMTLGGQLLREQKEPSKTVAFDVPSQRSSSDEQIIGDEIKKKTTDDWVLEYLRGGWLANSPVTTVEPALSPVFHMPQDLSPVGSLRRLHRTDSDEVSPYSESGDPFQGPTSSFHASRGLKHTRPIPTMAQHLKGKAGNEANYIRYAESSTAPRPGTYFTTPTSIMSGATIYHTPDSGSKNLDATVPMYKTSAWNAYLREKGLIPNPFDEMDWSGRGQHAEFEAAEEPEIPLLLENALGHSASALVESVRCRRIRLARKTVAVSRRLKKEEVIKEVEHLQRLRHSHIIRVVGTYTLPRKLSILLYPVAEHTLDQFLESIVDEISSEERSARLYSVSTFLRCLAKAVAYIHDSAMKHMDIKPKNLLVRDMRNSTICNQGQYKIYIADFGIARSYRSVDDCNTGSPTAYTPMYAAPEVVAQERRDQKADIFSLGAVYTEMLAVLGDENEKTCNSDLLLQIRDRNPTDRSYQANSREIQTWLRGLSIITYGFESDSNDSHITELVARMLSIDPTERPTAATLVNNIPFLAFCCDVNGGSEPFEAADRPAIRQCLYDRALEISEAELRYFRCMVDGCVKVYWSRDKLEYHEINGHGENSDALVSTNRFSESVTSVHFDQGTNLSHASPTNDSKTSHEKLYREFSHNFRWS